MKPKVIFSIVAVAALLALPGQAVDSKQFGKIDSAKKLMGRVIHDSQDQKIGDLKDMVVDLESGHVLYGIVSAGGFLGIGDELTAVPPSAFTSSSEQKLTMNVDKEKLKAAPRFTKDHDSKLGDPEFVKRIHQHFAQNMGWEGSFNNVHKASEVIGMNVKNTSDQKIGDIKDLGIDLPAGRVAFAILGAGGFVGVGEKDYVLPPNAFTLGSDKKSLVSGIDKEKLTTAPQFNNNWTQLSDRRFAAQIYQHYGKQPYWDVNLTPTGREESRIYENQNNATTQLNDQNTPTIPNSPARANPRRNNQDNNGLRVRRGVNEAPTGDFAGVEEGRRLLGMNVRSANNEDLGTLNQIIVDLESGRALYGIVTLKGQGGLKAVPPQNLKLASDDKSVQFIGDASKLKSAPEFDRKADQSVAEFAGRVYTHFGQERNWFDSSAKFGNVYRLTELLNAKVQNSQNQNLGQVHNALIDLPKARVLYVILSAAPALGKGDNLLAIPPNAFTKGSDQKTLVTGLDKAKLEAAPRFSRTNLRELANTTKATEIYQYYGKQPYWNGLAPTGR
jgi:sporulation protein YlmC with PRC-barrel domain